LALELIPFDDVCGSQLWRNGERGRWRGPDKENWRKMEQLLLKLDFIYSLISSES